VAAILGTHPRYIAEMRVRQLAIVCVCGALIGVVPTLANGNRAVRIWSVSLLVLPPLVLPLSQARPAYRMYANRLRSRLLP
jgi:hypothetical protein